MPVIEETTFEENTLTELLETLERRNQDEAFYDAEVLIITIVKLPNKENYMATLVMEYPDIKEDEDDEENDTDK